MVDARGGAAALTGADCNPWAGGQNGNGYAITANSLVSGAVVAEMERAFLASAGQPLARRLLGDRRRRRGRSLRPQRAAPLVPAPASSAEQIAGDLRVDDPGDPLAELARLLALNEL